ncbi:MAG: hypothetical protein ACKVYV_15235 [Limisphaerales bacterium]
MGLRLALLLALLFFGTMNVLLWRAEYGGARHAGGGVPVARVVGLILNAPDDSPLALFRRGERLGSIRWFPQVLEEPAAAGEFEPEGIVRGRQGYKLNLDGNLFGDEAALRLRFNGHVTLDRDRSWRELRVRTGFRPLYFEVEADAASRQFQVTREDAGERAVFSYPFAQLAQPQRILADLGGLGWLALMGTSLRLPDAKSLADSIQAEAGLDWLRVGQARLRVYRLEVRGPDRQQAVIYVSRAGEILKAQLPGQVSLIHDSLVP